MKHFLYVYYVLIVFLLLTFFGFSAFSQTDNQDSNKLRRKISIENNKDVYKYLKKKSTKSIFKILEQASISNDDTVIFYTGSELIERAKNKKLKGKKIYNYLNKNNLDTNFSNVLISILYSNYRNLKTNELVKIFNVLNSSSYMDKNISIEREVMLMQTNNLILSYLNAYNHINKDKVQKYGNNLCSIMLDKNKNPHLRRTAIKGIQYIGYKEAAGDLLTLISDTSIVNNKLIARPLCITLSQFKEIKSFPYIKYILENTTDEYVFGTAAIALSDIGGKQSLKALVENENRFHGKHSGVTIYKMKKEIIDILKNKDNEMLPYAIKATKYLYKQEEREQYKLLLKEILNTTEDKSIIKHILKRFEQIIDKDEAKDIIDNIPYNNVYGDEWNNIRYIYNSKHLSIINNNTNKELNNNNNIKGNKNAEGNMTAQEYGDAAYQKNSFDNVSVVGGTLGIHFTWLGHAALYAGFSNAVEQEQIAMVTNQSSWDTLLNFSFDLCDVSYLPWGNIENDTEYPYRGAYTIPSDLSFEERKSIVNTANLLTQYNIGYTIGGNIFFPQIASMLQINTFFPGSKIDPNEISQIRCDGVIEYCYEFNGIMVWGRNGDHYDISNPNWTLEHNLFFWDPYILNHNPDHRLAPIVQCGGYGVPEATTNCTNLNSDAIIDLPTYNTYYDVSGDYVTVTIYATDKSGIHYIKYKVGSSGTWECSDIQPQHPVSDTYPCTFTAEMPNSDYIYFYAMDNGGNVDSLNPESIYIDRSYTLMVNPTNIGVGYNSGNASFNIGSDEYWTINETCSWLYSLSQNNGSGNATISFQFDNNPSASSRSCNITVNCGTLSNIVTVTQSGYISNDCSLSVYPLNINVGHNAGSTSFQVNSDNSWEIVENCNWLGVSSQNGTGDETITINYNENTSSVNTQSCNININCGVSSKTVTITQENAASELSVYPTTINLDYNSGNTILQISSNGDWHIIGSCSWLNFSQSNGGSGIIGVAINYNENFNITFRTCEFTVTCGTLTKNLIINQEGAPYTLSVNPTNINLDFHSGDTAFEIHSNYDWNIVSPCSWLNFSNLNSNGDEIITITYDENNFANPRSCDIEIICDSLSEINTISQSAAPAYLYVSPEDLFLDYDTGNVEIVINSNSSWSIADSCNWLAFSESSGFANENITIDCDSNTSINSREFDVIISSDSLIDTVSITQYGTPRVFILSPEKINVDYSAGDTSFTINSNGNWSIPDSCNWLNISPPLSDSGNASITINYDGNLSSCSRAYDLFIDCDEWIRTFEISQECQYPNLNITNPTSGDTWNADTIYSILWYDNIGSDISIDLYKGGSFNNNIDTTESDSSYIFYVPYSVETGSDYQIKLTSIFNQSINDNSNLFTIKCNDKYEINDHYSQAYNFDTLTDIADTNLCITAGDGDWFKFIYNSVIYYFKVTGAYSYIEGDYGLDFQISGTLVTIETFEVKNNTDTKLFLYDNSLNILAVDDNGGDNSFSKIEYDLASNINEIELTDLINIFPNPAKDKLNIEFEYNTKKIEGITLYNATGGVIYTIKGKDISSDKMEIDISNFSSGVYTVEIITEDGEVTKKFTVIK